jgi:hypothetical protein
MDKSPISDHTGKYNKEEFKIMKKSLYKNNGSFAEYSSQIEYTRFDKMFNENENKRVLICDSYLDDVKLDSVDYSKKSDYLSKNTRPMMFKQLKHTKNFVSFRHVKKFLRSSPNNRMTGKISQERISQFFPGKKGNIKSGFRSKSTI